jgi:large subunit ribosomal protein L16
MGGGKGELEEYVAVVKPGLVLFEMSGIPEESAREAIRRAGHKLSVRTQFIKNE